MNLSRTASWFLKAGVVLLVAGALLGVVMHHQHSRALVGAHAHVTVAGGLLSILYALCYQQFPPLDRSRLAAVHAALHFGACAVLFGLLIAFGIGGRVFDDGQPHVLVAVVVGASLALFASMLAFAANVFINLQPARGPRP